MVFVSQPVTTSTCPLISGVMSPPIGMMLTSFSGILFCASRARSSTMPVGWMPTFLPTMSAGFFTGFFCIEKKQYGWRCAPMAKALDRDPLGRGQHDRRARRHLAGLVATGGDDRHAVDVGAAGLDRQVDAFLVVVAQALGHHLADLVAADEPAQLQVDVRLVRGERVDRDDAARGRQAAGQLATS